MVDLPAAMLRNGRASDERFLPDEYLYRRVPLELWDDGDDPLGEDAIELPDMSVNRSKYSHPEWTRLERENFSNWGVVGFQVQEIPSPLLHLGHFEWTFEPVHVPLKSNYPHSEVQAFEDRRHIDAKARLDPHVHLRWRKLLLEKVKTFIRPNERVTIREQPPSISR